SDVCSSDLDAKRDVLEDRTTRAGKAYADILEREHGTACGQACRRYVEARLFAHLRSLPSSRGARPALLYLALGDGAHACCRLLRACLLRVQENLRHVRACCVRSEEHTS